MKIVAINGSPRKDFNSAKMLKSWVEGYKSVHPDVEVEYVNLYSLKFTGCTSCFSCKRINGKFYGQCPIKDDLLPLIPKLYEADAVAIASPIYFGDMNAYTKCLLERALFSHTTYRKNHESLAKKPVPVTVIYTMNCPKELAAQIGYLERFKEMEAYISNTFLTPCKRVCAYNTYQFLNYANYEMEMFTEEEKRLYRDNNFENDCKAAYDSAVETANQKEFPPFTFHLTVG